jgi:hypothetical protein
MSSLGGKQLLRFSDPRQERVSERLDRLVGPGPAAFWRDACRLQSNEASLESATHLIAHLLREIESALRDVLEPVAALPDDQPKEGSSQEGHKAAIRTILRALDVTEDDTLAKDWLSLAGRGEGALHSRAHRDSLASPRPSDVSFQEWWDRVSTVLDTALGKLEVRFGVYKQVMDDLAGRPCPSRADAKTLKENVPNSLITQAYFFSKPLSPAWLVPLASEGFFSRPPAPIHREDGVTIPVWPAARYLPRVANSAPEQAMEVILSVPYTENMSVHRDFAEAALAEQMPIKQVVAWAMREADWIPQQDSLYLGLPMKLGSVVHRLAERGETEAALALAAALLDVLPAHQPRTELPANVSWKPSPEPRARFDQWEYEQILNKTAPTLVAAAGEPALNLLCDLLEKALRLSRRGDETGSQDLSYVWRPAIEDSGQNLNLGIKPILVTAVRDIAEKLVSERSVPVGQVVGALEERSESGLVFQRIALHLLRKFPDSRPFAERLTNRRLFDEVGVRHEYVLLLNENFAKLKPDEREMILGWIDQGPGALDILKARLEEFAGRPVADEEVEEAKRAWQRERLEPIKRDLQGRWRALYESLIQKTGAPEHPEFPFYVTGGAFGPASPKAGDDLARMSAEELASYLRTWVPTSTDPIHGATIAGLAGQLTAVISAEPERFTKQMEVFQLSEPTYVRAILSGFLNASGQGRELDWAKVLPLCNWAVQQQGEEPVKPPEPLQMLDRDAGWGEARKTVMRLLAGALDKDPCPISFNLRDAVWGALEPLTRDPDPRPDDEERYLFGSLTNQYARSGIKVRNVEVLTFSINTVRGEAMHTVVRYALWVRRSLEKQNGGGELLKQGFGAIPEVQRVLEERLDPAKEPSTAIRCVYGRALPWLHQIDPGWVKEAAPRIFPIEPSLAGLWEAAWEGYIASWPAYGWMYESLHKQYRRAIDNIGNWPAKVERIVHLDEQLARHLMALNWLGSLASEPDTLDLFYQRAGDELRANAMNFVGWSLYRERNPIPGEILVRLKAFWESRFRAAQAKDPPRSASAKEMAQFGWWFASAKFDDEWVIRQLRGALEISGQAVPDHLVVPRLAELSQRMPLEAIECLALIVEGDKDGSGPYTWGDSAKIVIRSALNAADPHARQRAIETANRLASRSHFEFVDLVKGSGGTPAQ